MRKFTLVFLFSITIFLSSCGGGHIEKITFTCPNGQLAVGATLELQYVVEASEYRHYATAKVNEEGIVDLIFTKDGISIEGIAPGYVEISIYDVNDKDTHDKCGISVIE